MSCSPEITRDEYLCLLRTARRKGQRRTYLLTKLFALTGVPVQCLNQITVELVRSTHGVYVFRQQQFPWNCPSGLRTELLAYAEVQGIASGPIFLTRANTVIDRTQLWRDIKKLCCSSGLPPEKGNPRVLRKLYLSTQEKLLTEALSLCQDSYSQLLDSEQEYAGWTGYGLCDNLSHTPPCGAGVSQAPKSIKRLSRHILIPLRSIPVFHVPLD